MALLTPQPTIGIISNIEQPVLALCYVLCVMLYSVVSKSATGRSSLLLFCFLCKPSFYLCCKGCLSSSSLTVQRTHFWCWWSIRWMLIEALPSLEGAENSHVWEFFRKGNLTKTCSQIWTLESSFSLQMLKLRFLEMPFTLMCLCTNLWVFN